MSECLASPFNVPIMAADGGDWHRWLEALGVERADHEWLIFGLGAQLLVAVCLLIHVVWTRRGRQVVIPPVFGYVGLIAMLMLLVYAAQRHDLVFVVGQFLNTLICVWLLVLIRRRQDRTREEDAPRFPIVAPDSAERKISRDKE
jgi:lipid-A-disaccharide synthase-like uncharacterized protein